MNREAMSDAEFITAMQQGLPPLPAPDTIQRGNEGIDPGTWTGWTGPKDFAPLPQYPQPGDLPPTPPPAETFEQAIARAARGMVLADLAFNLAFLAVGVLAGLLLSALFGGAP